MVELLIPRGSSLSEAVRVFFKKPRLPEAAHYEWPEALEDKEEQQAMKKMEDDYAFMRLQKAVGSELWPKRRIRSVAELRELAERGNR